MKNRMKSIVVLTVLAFGLMVSIAPAASQTITGEISDAYELVADDGSVYIISDTEKGEELAAMVGETVTVTGSVMEVDGEKSISVDSFMVIEK